MDCAGWPESGFQSMYATKVACEQTGFSAGSDKTTCSYVEDTGMYQRLRFALGAWTGAGPHANESYAPFALYSS